MGNDHEMDAEKLGLKEWKIGGSPKNGNWKI
jgi:hypothetical protein